jgi:ribose transport system substrate-binding protein
MKRLTTIVVTVLFAAAFLGAFATMNANAAEKYLKIGYSMPAATAGYMARAIYWAKKGMADWEAKDKNIEFLYVNAENVTKQANDIEDLMAKGINVLIVWPYDASVTSVIEKAYKAGIYTVVMDRGTSKVCYDVYLSNDDEGYTREGTEWLCKKLNYRGNMVIIEGIPCPINTVRIETIKKTAAQYPGIKILDSQPGNWRKDQALAIMENYLQKYRKIDAVYTADDDMMLGALQAYKESGRRDIKYFLGGA